MVTPRNITINLNATRSIVKGRNNMRFLSQTNYQAAQEIEIKSGRESRLKEKQDKLEK